MKYRVWAPVIAGLVALGGCTGMDPVTGPGSNAAASSSDASETVAPSASEPSEQQLAAVSEPPSEAPTNDGAVAAATEDAVADSAGASAVADSDAADEQTADDVAAAQDDAPARRPRRLVAVRVGDRGAPVEKLQRRLAKLGFAPGPVDGAYGPRTKAAVEAFQMLAGLKRNGRANARTVASLEEYRTEVTVLKAGDTGRAVKKLQKRLAAAPFDPGPADGAYGPKTVEAVWALEKLAGVPVDGNWGPLDEYAFARLEDGKIGKAKRKHKKRWVEFDLSQQVMKVYDPGEARPVLVSHASSGSGIPWKNEHHSGNSITPTGNFVISRRIDGWRESSLDIGRMYNPLYFNGGIAFHGATSVPLYPASHGCVRLPMHIAEYLPDELPNGTPVHVLR
jgi:peptidoglycan hydrolase-like protein with peptidoglycan-binding domain